MSDKVFEHSGLRSSADDMVAVETAFEKIVARMDKISHRLEGVAERLGQLDHVAASHDMVCSLVDRVEALEAAGDEPVNTCTDCSETLELLRSCQIYDVPGSLATLASIAIALKGARQ